ncbi:citrate synthase-lysine N-methyltransferase CSKMT, mitochondrial [Callorhinchus milii]|uniref:citrate synthase-lysine N-methyltransferase CSKMT, mitochondrial n=1 Tax=Callorhinchus milii TaxID=7868 RepID=UPI001C3F7F9E|nr:citrate synthase-lysine N-methyltransferase CSKMT, mitochondrial [Callorhinchus milii]
MDERETWDRIYEESSRGDGVGDGFGHLDWFFPYGFVSGLLASLLAGPGVRRALDLGCGTSGLGPGLYARCPFPVRVTGVDFSPVAVRLMRERFGGLPPSPPAPALAPGHPASRLDFVLADVTDLSAFRPSSFHLVLDKGTSDALLRSPGDALASPSRVPPPPPRNSDVTNALASRACPSRARLVLSGIHSSSLFDATQQSQRLD